MTYRIPGKTDGTKRRYTYISNVVKKYFGTTRLNDINRSVYQNFINEYGKNHSKVTIKKLNGILKSCVSDAREEGIIPQNFTNRINEVWNETRARHIEYLSIKEIQSLLKVTQSSLNRKHTIPYAILTAIETGMRAGKILALKWSDIDEKKQTIKISKSYDYISKKIKPPKNESSKRVIYVSKSLLNILNELKENNQEFVKRADHFRPAAKTNKIPCCCFISKANCSPKIIIIFDDCFQNFLGTTFFKMNF